MHPAGDEVVVCTAGAMTLHQEFADGRTETVALGAGDYAINPPGVWHTADVDGTRRPRCSSPPASAPSTARAELAAL